MKLFLSICGVVCFAIAGAGFIAGAIEKTDGRNVNGLGGILCIGFVFVLAIEAIKAGEE